MKTLDRPKRRFLFEAALLLVVAGATSACEEFLTGAPQGALDEVTLANQAGVEATLIAAYRDMDLNSAISCAEGWGAAASNWVWGSISSDDAYKGSDAGDQPSATDIELYNWGTAATEIYTDCKWRIVFDGVVRSNATIKLLDKVLEESPGEISDFDANGIRGEALFLRAHYHFEAWRIWGNIAYYTEDDTDFRKSNVGVNVAGNLLSDLDQAISLLPTEPRNGDVGRATQWTAKAYKGRVQVYAGDYAGALTTLGEFESGGPYTLDQNFEQVWSGFEDQQNGPETIFAYQASVNDGNPDAWNSNWGEFLNFPHGGSPFGCCGFHQASQNLVNFFRVDANGLPLALSDPNWNANDDVFDAAASDRATTDVPVDPRLDWTVGRDGVPYYDWGLHAPGWIRDRGFSGPYSPKKNAHESASGAQSNVGWGQIGNSVNIHIFRYADLLLLLAEAEVEAGSLDDARTLVNAVRERASRVAQGPGTDVGSIAVPIDDPSITWADYAVGQYPAGVFPWDNQENARTAVRYERRLELAMEGQRFFDLRRWQNAPGNPAGADGLPIKALETLNAYIAAEQNRRAYLSNAQAFADRHSLYPIPPVQIELSKTATGEGGLTQNLGW